MPDVSYVPGPLTAVAGGWCLALIEASPDSPVVARIWAEAGRGARPDAVLGGLIADGLGNVPGFVMLATGDDGTHRLFCRGTVGATVYGGAASGISSGGATPGGATPGSDAPGRIDGAGLLTWREQVVSADVRRIVLGELPDGGALRLPAASGVLLAGCVVVDLAGPALSGSAMDGPVVSDPVVNDSAVGGPVLGGAASRGDEDSEDIVKTIVLDTGAQHLPPHPVVQGIVLNDTVNQDEVPRDTVTDAQAGAVGTDLTGSQHGYPDTITMTTPQPPKPSRPLGPPPGVPGSPNQPGPPGSPGSPGPSSVPGGLIDVPPWLAAPGAPTPAGGLPAWDPQPAGGLPAWAPQPSQPQPPAAEPTQSPWGEAGPGEPGATLQRADLAGLVTGPPDRIGPVVPALICPAGHLNPPSGAACRRCGAPLPHDPVPVPRPVLGVLRLSLGGVITLDRGVIMGRNPRADFAGPDGEERPHVVRLPSADGDISRNHVRVDLDGWHVLVTDLNSTNGTLVTLPGRDPQQLRPGEPVPIQPNTVVTLADGIDFRYEVTG